MKRLFILFFCIVAGISFGYSQDSSRPRHENPDLEKANKRLSEAQIRQREKRMRRAEKANLASAIPAEKQEIIEKKVKQSISNQE